MQESVPSATQSAMAVTLFDEWVRAGLADVVVCPGSRSTPLSLAASRCAGLRVHVRLDERSAGFFAIGRALASARPVVVVVTSGTAAAELHAAVAEADLARVPLLVATADRPPELHGVGAAQTIDQRHLYGSMVRRFEEPGVARPEARATWRPMAARLWAAATGLDAPPGPVHVNLAFVEPLVAEPSELVAGRPDGAAWMVATRAPRRACDLDVAGRRVMAVVGAGAEAQVVADCATLDWVVVGDATARGALAHADPLLRDDARAAQLAPDLVVRLGGLPASRVVAERLRAWGAPVIALRGAGPVADPDGVVARSLDGVPDPSDARQRGDGAYAAAWRDLSAAAAQVVAEVEEREVGLSEVTVARAAVASSARHAVPLVVGSSMPVRDVEWWAPARVAPTYANRGANGIDGVVSTALGVGAGARSLGLVGDLTLLHDVSGLVEGLGGAGTCVLVVVDNGGGGIFSFLPQAQALGADEFERLFATPRGHDLVAVARGFGHAATRASTRDELAAAIDAGLGAPGVTVVVAGVVSRSENVRRHDELVEAIGRLERSPSA
ncbi:MAG: 2-succinyl-5-enolpyruvyl-6-hydroxy-3-cyclohexene-1-carboxylic-acid synthase [Acidobacteriota bacterium]|nr:2-succinyl-5-enolpyruvyl-6-hydroxy-3-cyclohexene-1-carboxylic-acid synthase [Acidobacteriota bacterium]